MKENVMLRVLYLCCSCQRQSSVLELRKILERYNALDNTIIVSANSCCKFLHYNIWHIMRLAQWAVIFSRQWNAFFSYFMMTYLNKQIAYRQMSLFVTSTTRPRSFIWWCFFIYIAVLLERAAKMSRRKSKRFIKQHYLLLQTQSVMFLHIFQQTLFLLLIGPNLFESDLFYSRYSSCN